MIKRYRINTQLLNYKATFEMVLDSTGISHPTLSHMRELIYKHDQREIHPQEMHTFHEGFTEVKVLGNSRSDLIPPDFRMLVMGDALCLRFHREDHRIEKKEYVDRQVLMQDSQEWDDQIEWWREDKDEELLNLAGVPLKAKKPKLRKPKKEVAAVA